MLSRKKLRGMVNMYHVTIETDQFIQGEFVSSLRGVQAEINFYFKRYPGATIYLTIKKWSIKD